MWVYFVCWADRGGPRGASHRRSTSDCHPNWVEDDRKKEQDERGERQRCRDGKGGDGERGTTDTGGVEPASQGRSRWRNRERSLGERGDSNPVVGRINRGARHGHFCLQGVLRDSVGPELEPNRQGQQ